MLQAAVESCEETERGLHSKVGAGGTSTAPATTVSNPDPDLVP